MQHFAKFINRILNSRRFTDKQFQYKRKSENFGGSFSLFSFVELFILLINYCMTVEREMKQKKRKANCDFGPSRGNGCFKKLHGRHNRVRFNLYNK